MFVFGPRISEHDIRGSFSMTRPSCPALAVLGCLLIATPSYADPTYLPKPDITPGATSQRCMIDDIDTEGYTKTVRPPASYTNRLKKLQLGNKYKDQTNRPSCVEEDHLIPLSWCGNPRSRQNLWPQIRRSCGAPAGQSAEDKDDCEYKGMELLRQGDLDLAEAQKGIAGDWIKYCQEVVLPLAKEHEIGSFKPGTPNE